MPTASPATEVRQNALSITPALPNQEVIHRNGFYSPATASRLNNGCMLLGAAGLITGLALLSSPIDDDKKARVFIVLMIALGSMSLIYGLLKSLQENRSNEMSQVSEVTQLLP